ncbi:single-stranded DNA-binding protein [Acidipila sp. EB88]|nr:single-stranded DNA-binding protein [Acidipila sp. EB88]
MLTTSGGMRLSYRITAGPDAADPDGFEAREIYVEIDGPDAPMLVERNGELLRAMEHLAAKLIHLESEEHDKLSFDAGNFKGLRARDLRLKAQTAATQVQGTGQPYAFAPMTSGERRLLHLAFRDLPDVQTGSVGEGSQRMLVVYPLHFDRATYTPPTPLPSSRAYSTGGNRVRPGGSGRRR